MNLSQYPGINFCEADGQVPKNASYFFITRSFAKFVKLKTNP